MVWASRLVPPAAHTATHTRVNSEHLHCLQAQHVLDIAPLASSPGAAVLTACAQWGHEAEEASGLLQESWDLAGSKMERSRGASPHLSCHCDCKDREVAVG